MLLVTTIVLNTKFGGVENIVPNVTNLAKKRNYGAKIKDIEKKYFTTADCNKFTSETLKSDIFNIIKNSDIHTTLTTLAT